jgi:hypothetical protein
MLLYELPRAFDTLSHWTQIGRPGSPYGPSKKIGGIKDILYQYDHLFWSRVTEADEEKSFRELSRSQFFLKSWSAVTSLLVET